MAYNSYWITTPTAGANLHGMYPLGVPAGSPSTYSDLGIEPGLVLQGSKNTRWMYVLTAPTAAVTVPGTAINISATTFLAGAGTGGISGTPIVAAPANTGIWCEITAATLSPTALQNEPLQNPGESDEDFKERVMRAHRQMNEEPDGKPIKMPDRADDHPRDDRPEGERRPHPPHGESNLQENRDGTPQGKNLGTPETAVPPSPEPPAHAQTGTGQRPGPRVEPRPEGNRPQATPMPAPDEGPRHRPQSGQLPAGKPNEPPPHASQHPAKPEDDKPGRPHADQELPGRPPMDRPGGDRPPASQHPAEDRHRPPASQHPAERPHMDTKPPKAEPKQDDRGK